MIVVLGRPGRGDDGRLDRPAGRIALAAAAAGGRVELVGTIGDDAAGDEVIVALGQAGIGHAAVLRDPGALTPGQEADDEALRLPRLDAADIDLGLRYIAECDVLVVAEPLPAEAIQVVVEAAAYHGAALVVLRDPETELEPADLPDDVTVLEPPAGAGDVFADLVGRYVALLDARVPPADAWSRAVGETGWEPAVD